MAGELCFLRLLQLDNCANSEIISELVSLPFPLKIVNIIVRNSTFFEAEN